MATSWNHLGIKYTPPRSIFSDSNARRDEIYVRALYGKLYKHIKCYFVGQLKQNFPLKYYLGNNENAIKNRYDEP